MSDFGMTSSKTIKEKSNMNVFLVILIILAAEAAFMCFMSFVAIKFIKEESIFFLLTLLGFITTIFLIIYLIGSSCGIHKKDMRSYKEVQVISVLNDTNSNTIEIKLLHNEHIYRVSTNDKEMGKVFEDNIDKKVDIVITPWMYAPSKEGQSNNIVSVVKLSENNKGEK